MDNNPPSLKIPWARVLFGCILALSGFTLVVLSSACYLIFLHNNNRQPSGRKSVLNSALPFNKVVVPFTNHKGHIFVTANFDGNPLTCLIDTGVRDVLCQNLPRNGRDGGKSFGYNNPLGYKSHARYVTLDRVDLGELQLSNPDCVSITANGIGIANTVDGIPINTILGNSVFKDVIVTIDFSQNILIFRSLAYDISKIPLRVGCVLLDVSFLCPNQLGPAAILAQGQIEGQSVPIMLDTGHAGQGIVLSSDFRKKLSRVHDKVSKPNYTIFARPINNDTTPLHWKIGDMTGISKGLVMSPKQPGSPASVYDSIQAVVGYDVLRHYRITIDYSRKKVLFEPASGPSPEAVDSNNSDFPPLPICYHWKQHKNGTWEQMPNTE